MSTVTRPSGPLPPRVYWVRRLLVLALVGLLAYGLLRAFSGEQQPARASGRTGEVTRQQPARPQGEQPGAVAFTDRPGRPDQVGRGRHRPGDKQPLRDRGNAKQPVRPAEPDGPCLPTEVLVQPLVSAGNEAGDPVEIRLLLRTTERAACTLTVTPDSLQVKVMSGEERVWTTQECPDTIFPVQLVLRQDQPLTYRVPWSGDRSAPRCPPRTPPVAPGSYVAAAAIVGGEPAETTFQLDDPAKKRSAGSDRTG